MSTFKCRDCEYCVTHGYSSALYGYNPIIPYYPQPKFYCNHNGVDCSNPVTYRNGIPGFICLGTPEKDSTPLIKTSPRWCPRKGETNE